MLEYLVICLTALGISAITLLSGFGLGTVLMPVFALFFPLPVAIAATAVVHVANNLFKALLVGLHASWKAVLLFGLPAGVAAVGGALLLGLVASLKPLTAYSIGTHQFQISLIGLVIGAIVIVASLFDLIPQLRKLSFKRQYLPVGGALWIFWRPVGISGDAALILPDQGGVDQRAVHRHGGGMQPDC